MSRERERQKVNRAFCRTSETKWEQFLPENFAYPLFSNRNFDRNYAFSFSARFAFQWKRTGRYRGHVASFARKLSYDHQALRFVRKKIDFSYKFVRILLSHGRTDRTRNSDKKKKKRCPNFRHLRADNFNGQMSAYWTNWIQNRFLKRYIVYFNNKKVI